MYCGRSCDSTVIRGSGDIWKPVPRAIQYFRKSQLKDGRLARFYELQTNRPLYFHPSVRLDVRRRRSTDATMHSKWRAIWTASKASIGG